MNRITREQRRIEQAAVEAAEARRVREAAEAARRQEQERADKIAAMTSVELQRKAIDSMLEAEKTGWAAPATSLYAEATAFGTLAILAAIREQGTDGLAEGLLPARAIDPSA